MIAAVVVNYRQQALTRDCVASLVASARVPDRIVVVDNAAASPSAINPLDDGSVVPLPDWLSALSTEHRITYLPFADNLGFAEGCNRAIELILLDDGYSAVLLLNNDATVDTNCIARMLEALESGSDIGMVAATMLTADAESSVDSLGIVLFSCGIAANRKSTDERLLGPCGGAALYSTTLLQTVTERTGQIFESRFFCYAEDTDLAIRARLLGFDAVLAEDAVVHHIGSASTGGSDSDFVMYHGLRNSLSVLLRCLPARFFFRHGWKLPILQAMLLLKYLRQGRARLLARVWRDVWRERHVSLNMRRRLKSEGLLEWSKIRQHLDPAFYQHGYLKSQFTRLFNRQSPRSTSG